MNGEAFAVFVWLSASGGAWRAAAAPSEYWEIDNSGVSEVLVPSDRRLSGP